MTAAEFARWYWLKEELARFARAQGLSPTGSKEALAARIAAALAGAPPPEARPARAAAPGPLPEPLDDRTVIPAGQRCTQQLRAYFQGRVGPSFRFDASMRGFIAAGAGRTLGDALAHWHATRDLGQQQIGEQFELNRFTRAWHADHPGGTRAQLMKAWRSYRALPSDRRQRA